MIQSDSQHSQHFGSGILQEALEIAECSRREASHFAIKHKDRIKFLVELTSGTTHLCQTVAAYNSRLAILMRLLPVIPLALLRMAKLGYYAKVNLHPSVEAMVPKRHRWNILVGTYDSTQKIVLQCFCPTKKLCTFVKVGNRGSADQMENEITYLRNFQKSDLFYTPNLLGACLLSEGADFNIQVTEEFRGAKIPPALTKELCCIATEIAGESIDINGVPHTFSHGDFAPWNIRRVGARHIVFDWEHCGLRPEGYDVAYFIIMTEVALNKLDFDSAFQRAKDTLRQLIPALKLDKEQIRKEFSKTTKTLQF